MNRGRPNWEHLSEDLHVLITVEDVQNRAIVRLKKAVDEVQKLLVPLPDSEDDIKKLQLMELAILNGSYRGAEQNIVPFVAAATAAAVSPPPVPVNASMMPATVAAFHGGVDVAGPGGAPIILAPRLPIQLGHGPAPPPPSQMPLPPGAPMIVQFDPFLMTQCQAPAMQHADNISAGHPTMSAVAYVN